jgi:hypothetical protein
VLLSAEEAAGHLVVSDVTPPNVQRYNASPPVALGAITALVALPEGVVAVGHDNGYCSLYDARRGWKRLRLMAPPQLPPAAADVGAARVERSASVVNPISAAMAAARPTPVHPVLALLDLPVV